jgi:hypothetical protein
MSITNRLIDAKLLYDAGRHEGALLSVLIAVAASSRLRFPKHSRSRRDPSKEMGDGEAFETFMSEEMPRVGRCSVLFRGKCHSAEQIFYKWLRNNLIHEAKLSEWILFDPAPNDCQAQMRRETGPPERLVVTHSIVLLIAHVVCTAKENAEVPESVRGLFVPC